MTSNIKCPKCNENNATCNYNGDVGGVRYLDEYVLVCNNPNCGHKETQHIDGGDPSWDDWWTFCPYCQIKANIHPNS